MSYGPRGAGAGGGAERRSHASVLEAPSGEGGQDEGEEERRGGGGATGGG